MEGNNMQHLMNDTKWNEIRIAMYEFPGNVYWRTKDIENGHISHWDSEWFYHFAISGYKCIEWLEIRYEPKDREEIIKILKKIHVPGKLLSETIKIYGYVKDSAVDYL